MISEIEVYRMSGAGNLFSVIDNSKYNFNDIELFEIAVMLCSVNQRNDFMAEGLLAINESIINDFDVKYLNPDGSTGMMCGNGGRCAVDFAVSKLLNINKKSPVRFSMAGNVYTGELVSEGIRLTLPSPTKIIRDKSIKIGVANIKGTYVDVSSDHFVINFSDLSAIISSFDVTEIEEFAPNVRFHRDFGLAGVNVNIYKKAGDVVHLKTFERGVEKVTGACGTGAISTAVHLFNEDSAKFPLMIMPPSSIPVFVDFDTDYNGRIKKIYLSGHSEIIRKDIVKIK
ncbi:MAG: diaminopimelate epimerase [Candidatus Kapabacteria bacterium]|nr:diaminopimelate epimerase [Ignavibacteriota bacterium]MCW5885184.1 diaminopimelate epimerase [Candidatus Kapabacteria bacterium]